MVTESEVRKFLKLSVFQKMKLQKEDPKKYNELASEAKKQFDPESDPEAAKELQKK